jgi:hypothetical protein
MNELMERIIAAKETRRQRLAAFPIEEKLRILLQLQRMVAPILQQRGIDARPWEIEIPEARPPIPQGAPNLEDEP